MANSLAFVLTLHKLTFKHGEKYITPTMGKSNAFTLDSEMYATKSFWEDLVKDLRASHPGFDPKTDILKLMRTEFLTLLKNLSKARDGDVPKTSGDSVVNLTTPTKPTIQLIQMIHQQEMIHNQVQL